MARKQLGAITSGSTDDVTAGGSQTLTNKTITSPTINGSVTTNSLADAGVNNAGVKMLINNAINTYPESASFVPIPMLFNDIAFNNQRGGSVVVTKNGVTQTQGVNYDPDLWFSNAGYTTFGSPVNTDVYVITVTLCQSFMYNTYWGIQMGEVWAAKNVTIDTFYSGAWHTLYTTNGNTALSTHWVQDGTNDVNPVSQVRYTLTNTKASATSLRITSLFAVGYNSPLATSGFLPRGGGSLYGTNAAPPTLTAAGGDTNINLALASKGTGVVKANGVEVATISGTQTLTGKTIDLSSNTLTGTTAQFNTAISDGDLLSLKDTLRSGNLVIDSSFEDSTKWTSAFGTQVSSPVESGSFARQITATGAGVHSAGGSWNPGTKDELYLVHDGTGTPLALSPSVRTSTIATQFMITVRIRKNASNSGTGQINLGVFSVNGIGGTIGSTTTSGGISDATLSSASWTNQTFYATIGSSSSGMAVYLSIAASTTPGNIYYVDSVAVYDITGVGLWSSTAAATLSSKTIDNSNTIVVKDGSLTIQNTTSATKTAKFDASGLTAGTPRTFTLPDSSGTLALNGAFGDASTNTASSVDNTVVLFNSTTGKSLKQATAFSGIAKLASGVLSAVSAPTGTIVGDTDAQTLTNKRLRPRAATITSSATPAISTDDCDLFTITALATSITSMTSSLSGTPTDGQKLMIRIKDNGTSQTITWGASFASSGIATLVASTVAGKVHYVGLVYNVAASTWDCIAADSIGR